MAAKKSQRNAAFILFGIVSVVYVFNLFVFDLTEKGQLFAGGFGLVALGAIWIYLLGAPETLSCDRTLNVCRLVKPRFLLTPRRVLTLPLDGLRGVNIKETYVASHDGPGHTGYEVSLEMEDRSAHVYTVADSARRAEEDARRIRSFLQDRDVRTLVLRRIPWAVSATGAAFIFLGALLIIGALR